MKPILYYAKDCPDTKPFVDRLNELGIVYEEVEVFTSLKDLKQFLFVRDTYKVFDKIKGNMQIGIPCLVISETECILDLDKLNEL